MQTKSTARSVGHCHAVRSPRLADDGTAGRARQADRLRVLGIDPGLNVTGYAVVEFDRQGAKVCEAGIIRGHDRDSLTNRLLEIHAGVTDVIRSLKPGIMALEQLYSHYQRPRTAILMGHARGVICLAATQADIPVKHYSATQVKKILTGNGRAPKSQMQLAIQRELRLAALPEPADVADALAIALCHGCLEHESRHLRDRQAQCREAPQ
jgi:crossover junction endodeoxyribonuclease RuvC